MRHVKEILHPKMKMVSSSYTHGVPDLVRMSFFLVYNTNCILYMYKDTVGVCEKF